MLAYLLVSILTIIIFFLGLITGYYIGNKEIDKKIEQIVRRIKPEPRSGPIRPLTPEQRKAREPETKRQIDLINS